MSTRAIGLCVFAGICATLAGSCARADSDQIFSDGFDGPKWYVDVDSDTYGNPAVFVRSASQPPGYVANALDCDDSKAAVHPGAADDPDASFVDTNCDGIDGDIAKAIFVAPSGADSPSCGTQVGPCHSPAFAIGRLSVQRTQIYLQVGVYSGALTVSANAAFYGGYDVAWQRGPATSGGPNARLIGSTTTMGTHGAQAYAVYVAGGVQAVFDDLEIDASNTNATSNGNGANSYAVYADQNANVQLSRDRIVAAMAADGVAGTPGVDAAQSAIAAGGVGGQGMEYSIACDATSHGAGGAASTNTCANGRSVVAGKGGDGGTMDTSCSSGTCAVGFGGDCTANSGGTGATAAVTVGLAGTGGAGGSGSDSCGPTQPGFAGAISDGSGGLKGIGSLLIDGQWIADGGGGGTLGDNGGGGGGGGGAGGCDTGTDSYGAGGGGGGAGGCAATGTGSGGGGGGGSFGVFVHSATAAIDNCAIVLGHGGGGGKGGVAGIGQPGGAGGPGGLSGTPDAHNGGNGGNGGRGGVAGGGGGGQGGSAYGIYSFSSSVTSTGNSFVGGSAGGGGSGGASTVGPGAGQDGQSGIVANVGTCVALSACD